MDTPLETAHAHNKRIYEQMIAIRTEATNLMDWMPDYANYYPKAIARFQDLYGKLLVAVETLEYVGMEGILEVTVRSRTQTLTWTVDATTGRELGDVLMEHLRQLLGEVEDKILEARGRLAGQLTGGTPEEWHHSNVRFLALLLEKGPMLDELKNAA